MMTDKKPRILFADDDVTARLMMQAVLEQSGFAVELAEDGEAALSQFRAGPCDLLMLDVEMPGLDGYQVCAAVRAEVGDELPIVMVTGMDDEDSIERAFEVGATDFIAKPINWSLMGHRVKYLLRASQAMVDLRTLNARNEAILKAIPDLMLEVDREGRYLGHHSPRGDLLAAPPEVLLGRTVSQILPPAAAEACLAALSEADEKGFSTGAQYSLDLPQGTLWFELSIARKLVDSRQAPTFIVLARDITERKQAARYEQFRSRTLELLVGGEPLDSLLAAIVTGVEQLDPGMICSVLLLDADGRHLRHGAAPSLPDFYNDFIDGMEIGAHAGSCGVAAYTGACAIVAEIATHPDWAPFREIAARAGLGACWSQPIRASSGQVLGTFAIYHREPHTPSPGDVFLIEQSARLASIAIEKSLAAEQLRDSEERFRSIIERIPNVAAQGYALDGTVRFWNRASELLYGYTAEEAIGANLLDLIVPPELRDEMRLGMQRMMETGAGVPAGELLLTTKSGAPVQVFSSHTLVNKSGRNPELFCLDIDLTERKQAEKKLQLAASVFTHAREGIMIMAFDGTIIDVNDAFTRITGYARDEVLGRKPSILHAGVEDEEVSAAKWSDLVKHGYWQGETWNRRKNGDLYAETKTISAVRDAEGRPQQYVALFSDITALKEHEKRLEHLAHYDALTMLPNRVLLADRMQQAMSQAERRGQSLAVVYLDLDGFKAINDRHGHEIGDQLLVAVATQMKKALREGDTLARLGGDEFVAVLLDLADAASCSPMLTRLLAAAARPVQVGKLALQVSASLGVTFYPQAESVDADQLLRQADQVMYQAKLSGRNRYQVFDAAQDSSLRDHHESLERIRRALREREFVLHYQPKVNMRSGAVVGAEALIRWQHPQHGLLAPARFLPVIEDHALAIEVGEWVIATALSQIALWGAQGLKLPVSVNVGARQLQQPDFVARLGALLAARPEVDPRDLQLEVLETSALEDLVGAARVIDSCRGLGVTCALDDFGTGYSSLSYLKRLPVDQLKIDRSFVRDMLDDPDDLAILEGVIGLARAFRRGVIVEGVETVRQGELLLSLDCELAQGFAIARPMAAADVPGWAAAWRPAASWSARPALPPSDLPLLFARVEHEAWIASLDALLTGERDDLVVNHRQCRYGAWLATEARVRHGAKPAFQAIERLHSDLHALAEELCELAATGRKTEAAARLVELHALRDAAIEQADTLLRDMRR